jgi:hypothetical protein
VARSPNAKGCALLHRRITPTPTSSIWFKHWRRSGRRSASPGRPSQCLAQTQGNAASDPADLAEALAKSLKLTGPTVLDVVVTHDLAKILLAVRKSARARHGRRAAPWPSARPRCPHARLARQQILAAVRAGATAGLDDSSRSSTRIRFSVHTGCMEA